MICGNKRCRWHTCDRILAQHCSFAVCIKVVEALEVKLAADYPGHLQTSVHVM
jgi:hypothetical protein